jgi:hypothetical protein
MLVMAHVIRVWRMFCIASTLTEGDRFQGSTERFAALVDCGYLSVVSYASVAQSRLPTRSKDRCFCAIGFSYAFHGDDD